MMKQSKFFLYGLYVIMAFGECGCDMKKKDELSGFDKLENTEQTMNGKKTVSKNTVENDDHINNRDEELLYEQLSRIKTIEKNDPSIPNEIQYEIDELAIKIGETSTRIRVIEENCKTKAVVPGRKNDTNCDANEIDTLKRKKKKYGEKLRSLLSEYVDTSGWWK